MLNGNPDDASFGMIGSFVDNISRNHKIPDAPVIGRARCDPGKCHQFPAGDRYVHGHILSAHADRGKKADVHSSDPTVQGRPPEKRNQLPSVCNLHISFPSPLPTSLRYPIAYRISSRPPSYSGGCRLP